MSEIPRSELYLLAMTVAEAEDLAAAGEEDAGLDCLEAGRARAGSVLAAEPWGAELRRRYEKAVTRYENTYLGATSSG